MVRQTTKVVVLEVLGVFSLLVMAAIGAFAYMLSQGPIELGMFRDDVERAMTDARGGRPVTVETLSLQWAPSERRLFVVAQGVSLQDKDGDEAGWAERANLTLDAGAALGGKVEVIEAALQSGWLKLENTGPTVWEMAGEPLPPIPVGVLPESPQAWLDRINQVLVAILGGLETSGGITTFQSAAFDEMDVRIVGIGNEDFGVIESASGLISRTQDDFYISLAGQGSGLGVPGRFEVSLSATEAFQQLQANLDVGAWPLADLLKRFGADVFDDNDVVVGTHFSAQVSQSNGLEELGILLASQEGTLTVPGLSERVDRFNLFATYRPLEDLIELGRLDVETERLKTVAEGEIRHVLTDNQLRQLDLSAEALSLDFSPYFPEEWAFESVALEAEASDDFSIFAINRAAATIDGVGLQAIGEFEFLGEDNPDELPFSLRLSAETIGDITKDLVLSFWPETLGDGARRFVVANMEAGLITEARARIDIKPDSLAGGFLRNEDLDVRFSFQDGQVRFLHDVPPVSQGIGTARLRGNSFSLELLSGAYDDWELSKGIFEFPQFNPRGGSLLVSAEGSGPIRSILKHLDESRIQLQENTGFDPDRVSGTGTAQFYMERPALTNVPFEDVILQVTGELQDAKLEDVALGLDLQNATAQIDLTGERMVVSGFGDLDTAPIQFTWRDGLVPDETPASLSASAIVTADVLNAFGLMGRAYLTGEIPVEIQGQVGGAGLGEATFAMDLRDARISIDEIGWAKPAGEAARATLIYAGDAEASASTVRLESDRAKLDGDLKLSADGRLQELVLRRLFVDGAADVAGTISRTGQQGLAFELAGDFLDVSPLISDLDALGGAADAEALGVGVTIDARVDQLRLRRGLELNDAELKLNNAVDRLLSMEARGTTPDGASLAASYFALDPDQAPTIGLTSNDAGFLAQAFLGVDFIRGGEMRLSGTLGQEGRPTRLTARISDARLENAPFITQILSLASLRGLADTLSGDGVLFSEVVAPLRIGNGRYVIEGGRASGPALGLTMNGFVGTSENEIELDGVLVPSFGVNSMLGGVPVIGDLFVGREGEGIFSITYSVTGSLDRAQVAVNPLSAVTPGILRRIFENPSDTSIPASLPTDPDLKPPTAKLPELPEDEFIESAPGAG